MNDIDSWSIELLSDTKLTVLIYLALNLSSSYSLHCLSMRFARLTGFYRSRSLSILKPSLNQEYEIRELNINLEKELAEYGEDVYGAISAAFDALC